MIREKEQPTQKASTNQLRRLAVQIRKHALHMVHRAKASHIGSCLSIADILAVFYGNVLRIDPSLPDSSDRDRFILSKGHAGAILYAVLAECGFFPVDQLKTYCETGSHLIGHASHYVSGVELSTGSLGHGLPFGCGIALAAQRESLSTRSFVLLSDGELDEGSNWEAAIFAAHHGLDKLVAVVDYNKIQSFGSVDQVLRLDPLADKFQAFGWSVQEVNGHNIEELQASLCSVPFTRGKPSVVIAHTTKGKGVSFMEDQLAWHYKCPNDEQLSQAIAELENAA